jgi:hypothetical protein
MTVPVFAKEVLECDVHPLFSKRSDSVLPLRVSVARNAARDARKM